MKAGDVVNIPAEVKHWHGATKDSWFSQTNAMKKIGKNMTPTPPKAAGVDTKGVWENPMA